jgi:hypothetical protein
MMKLHIQNTQLNKKQLLLIKKQLKVIKGVICDLDRLYGPLVESSCLNLLYAYDLAVEIASDECVDCQQPGIACRRLYERLHATCKERSWEARRKHYINEPQLKKSR